MFLTRISISQPVFATMMMVALAVLGLVSYRQLNVDQFPDVDFPIVTVTTVYTGATPEAVEREVTKKIEEAINTVEGIRHVESTSQEGLSNIVVQFRVGVSTQVASQDIRGKVAAIRGLLPREIEEPVVQRLDANALPIVSVSVNAPGSPPRPRPRSRTRSSRSGWRRWRAWARSTWWARAPARSRWWWTGRGSRPITSPWPRWWTRCARRTWTSPPGSADRGATEALVRVAARGRGAAEIGRIPVKRAGNTTIFVSDLAQVVDGVEQAKNLALLDEAPALALDVVKQSGANTVAVADGIQKAVDKLAKELPPGVSLQIVRDDSSFIRDSIHDVNLTMILGGILTVLIVFVFLNSWRSTVITGLTLPISVIAAFTVMRLFGFTLNVMTLMGLSLAIGMLIDDAIVVRENIVRHLQRGKDHVQASLEGTEEIGLAVMATTFTIVAVFIPVAFMGGMVGQFFYEFGITVAAAVLVSLFVSFTLDPMLSSRWVDPDIEENRHDTWLGKRLARFNHWFDDLHLRYERILDWSLHHRKTVLAVALVAFLASFPILGMLGGDFMPDFNRGEYQIAFKATPGATLRETGERAREMVRRLKTVKDIEYTYTTIGEAGTTYRPVTEGVTFVKLRPDTGKSFSEVLREARTVIQDVPGMTYGLFEAGPFGQKPIQISVRGAEVDELDRISRDLMQAMGKMKGVADLETSLEKAKPELRVRVDRDRASDLGVPAGVIGTTLRAAVAGEVASVIEDASGDSHDVRVRLRADQRRFADDLLGLTVPTDKDDDNKDKLLVPLREMAGAEPGTGPSTIRRKDLVREVRVSANPDGRSLGEITTDIETAVEGLDIPPGYDILMGGDAEELKDMFANMMQALFLAVVFIYLILASQFGSFTQPFAIMLSLPLSLVGVALALLMTGDNLNIMSMIGLIMLMGLVTKNAILLVDFANHARREGLGRDEALVKAGSTRLRPIVMTTLAMIFGMLPLAFAIGAGAEMRAPMARAVIGGLITSTLLTLIVVPVVYTYLDGLRPETVTAFFARRRTARTAPAAAAGVTVAVGER